MIELKDLSGRTTKNLEDIFHNIEVQINKLRSNTEENIRIELYEIGRDLKKKALELIDAPKNGRIYRLKIGGKIITHKASAPGEAPAIITGRLRRSINYKVIGCRALEFASYNVSYSRFLEFADLIKQTGRGSYKIEPRPYLSAAYKIESVKFPIRLKNALIKASSIILS